MGRDAPSQRQDETGHSEAGRAAGGPQRAEAPEPRRKLHNLIFLGMAIGLGVGIVLHGVQSSFAGPAGAVLWWLDLLGPTLFIGALKMIIAPLIFASIVTGVTSLPNLAELGKIGYRTILFYLATTSIAVIIGLLFVLTVAPGTRASSVHIREQRQAALARYRIDFQRATGEPARDADGEARGAFLAWVANREGEHQAGGNARRWQAISGAEHRTAGDMFRDDIVKPILMNPFTALSASPPNALGIIFFAVLFGVACTVVGARASPVVQVFASFNQVIMTITRWLMACSPFAVACIIASLVAHHGPGVFRSLGWYVATVIAAIAVHVVMLLLIARLFAKVGPRELWRGIRDAFLIAFSTRSSAATLPVTMRCVIERLGVRPKVANFALPLGATVNMNGTALYEGVAVIFLIQIYGGLDDVAIQMTAVTTVLIFITAVLASVGAAAVPDAGLVTMVLVASAVHLPVYYIPLIFAVDALLDMFRTSTNVMGDCVAAVAVDRMLDRAEGEASEAIAARARRQSG